MRQSIHIIKKVISDIPKGFVKINDNKIFNTSKSETYFSMESLIHHFKIYSEGVHLYKNHTYVCTEAPKGETGLYLISDGTNKPYRAKIRSPGFMHLQSLNYITKGHMIADLVTIIGTLDIVFGEVDR